MCKKYYLLVLFSLCINNVIGGNLKSLGKDSGSQFDDTITKMLSTWMNEMDNKLAIINRNIEEKMFVLEKNITGRLESNLGYRLNELDKKIPNNLEEKLHTMEKHIHDTLKDHIDLKLDALEKNIPDILKKTIEPKLNALENRIEANLEDKLNALGKKIPDNLENKLNTKEKNIQDTLKDHVDQKLDALEKNIPDKLEKTIEPKLNALEKLEMEALKEIDLMVCKEQIVRGYNLNSPYHMENVTYNHIRRKKNGSLTEQFEMHVAIKAEHDGIIKLSATNITDDTNQAYEIVVGGTHNTQSFLRLHTFKGAVPHEYISTPNILSSTEYTLFYIKISDGILEFGKEGSSPLMTYSNSNVTKLEYFGFASWANHEAKFLYDCPSWDHGIV